MKINVNVEVNLADEVRDMSPDQQWELLQLVWEVLEEEGTTADWQSFYEENGLSVASLPPQEG